MPNTSLSTIVGFPGVPEMLPNERQHRQAIAKKINQLNLAKFNCTLDVTLNAATGATVIADNRVGFSSAVTPLMAMSLSGAVAIAAGIWCDNVRGSFGTTTATITVHHAINAATDQQIRFGILG